MAFAMIYEVEDTKERIEIPVRKVQGKDLLETESGQYAEPEFTLKDAKLGTLRYVDTVEVRDALPRPVDHAQRGAVAKFKTVYGSTFRSKDEEREFINSHKEIKLGFDDDFKDATIEQLAAWSQLVKTSVSAEEFGRYELTEHFKSPECGDIRIDSLIEYGTRENGWDQTWTASCYKCGAKLPNVKGSTILRMRREGKTFQCGKPCKVQGGR